MRAAKQVRIAGASGDSMITATDNESQTDEAGRSPLATGLLDHLVGFHLRMAQAAIYRDFVASVSGLGITQKQFAVLELISTNPGVSQIDLAGALGTDRATMMGLVERLGARGWLDRQVSRVDRRRQELRLTAAGQETLATARHLVIEHERRLLAGLTPDDRSALLAALKRLHGAD